MTPKTTYEKDNALRAALQQEEARVHLPEGLAERVMTRVRAERQRRRHRVIIARWIAGTAAAIAVGLFWMVPRISEARQLVRYEGSYIEVNGQRIDDLGRIKTDIGEALSMADQAERLANLRK